MTDKKKGRKKAHPDMPAGVLGKTASVGKGLAAAGRTVGYTVSEPFRIISDAVTGGREKAAKGAGRREAEVRRKNREAMYPRLDEPPPARKSKPDETGPAAGFMGGGVVGRRGKLRK
tara:strand:- start:2844 stop:3194 length:351 start_codon:yes stop_codon:yes gene_type:complete